MAPLGAVLLGVCLVCAAPASGREAAVTGKLAKRGYTVLALAYDGRISTARTRRNGSFRVAPTASRFTLHLRNRRGKYAGPVTAAFKTGRVIVGFKAGAKLGKVDVLRGHARPARRLPARFLDRRRTALARRGAPLGSGRNFGLVRSRGRAVAGDGRDRDLDGVPDAFDIDSDGDRVLNSVDRSAAAQGATAAAEAAPLPGAGPAPSGPPVFSQMFLELEDTVNAAASAASVAEIDSTLVKFLNIKLRVPRGDAVEMDCGGLVYCSPGGTGVVSTPPEEGGREDPFPSCCDPDGDGYGNLRGPGAAKLGFGGDELSLDPRARSTQIGSGDAFILRVGEGDAVTQTPVTLGFVFNSVPALATYDDGAGGAGTVSYPVAAGSPGTRTNPIPIRANPAGRYVFAATYFRPQRKGIAGAGEPSFIDIGGLRYAVQLPSVPGAPPPAPGVPRGAAQCSPASLSTGDPNLTTAGAADMGILQDKAADEPASASNKIAFSVDLSRCVADKGGSLAPGATFQIHPEAFAAGDSADHALQTIWLRTL